MLLFWIFSVFILECKNKKIKHIHNIFLSNSFVMLLTNSWKITKIRNWDIRTILRFISAVLLIDKIITYIWNIRIVLYWKIIIIINYILKKCRIKLYYFINVLSLNYQKCRNFSGLICSTLFFSSINNIDKKTKQLIDMLHNSTRSISLP